MRLVLIAVALLVAGSASAEMRCGWFADLTPQDLWPTDRDEAPRATVPRRSHWTNAFNPSRSEKRPAAEARPDGGFGCACLHVATAAQAKRIASLAAGAATPIAVCSGRRRPGSAEGD